MVNELVIKVDGRTVVIGETDEGEAYIRFGFMQVKVTRENARLLRDWLQGHLER